MRVIHLLMAQNTLMLRTDDEVNLWAEFEGKELVAHELVHLNRFDDAKFCSTLSKCV
jgi:hypothetical protein